MNWLLLIFSSFTALFLWTLFSIFRNYTIARRIGFPIIVSPVAPLNPFYIIFTRSFPSLLEFLKNLPFGLGTWARCTYMGWSFDDKHALHDEYGPVFTLVTPGGNEVTVANAEAAHTILARRKEFIKPAIMYDQLNIFGRNLNTVEGKDWERQRRLIAPSFNEKTSAAVWDEAVQQTQDMVTAWEQEGAKGTFETVSDTSTLALHVLTRVGFGIQYPFHGGVRRLPKDHVMSYRDALLLCLQNVITFAIIPKRLLSFSFLPQKLRTLGVAVQEFQRYMEEMLSHRQELAGGMENTHSNLTSTLIRASESAQETDRQGGSKNAAIGLTDEEVFGNIFAFNLAGHETTANTIAAALVLLAAYPNYQEWICEEIDQVFPAQSGYETVFPRLERCLAIMYETLRLHGSIVFIPKSTSFHTQIVEVSERKHVLPPNTAVNINVQALHSDPNIWGPDALEWKPDRWLRHPSTITHKSQEATFIEPERGSYIPWADGPRVCIGRKFSQVEFVGVISTLFHYHKVRPATVNGHEGKQALTKMINEMGITYITVQMKSPKDVALVWEKR